MFIGTRAALPLAALGVSFVLDIIPRETLGDAAVKWFVALVIVAAASVVVGPFAPSRSNGRPTRYASP